MGEEKPVWRGGGVLYSSVLKENAVKPVIVTTLLPDTHGEFP